MNYTCQYFEEAIRILQQLDQDKIEQMLDLLLEVRQRGGRVFFLGVGGGAGHASHAVQRLSQDCKHRILHSYG